MYANNLSLFFSFLCLRLCLCLRHPCLHVQHNDASKHKHKSYVVRVKQDDARAYACVVLVYT